MRQIFVYVGRSTGLRSSARNHSVNPECVGYPRGQQLNDVRSVENHCDQDGQHHELHEPGDLASKEEEQGHDAYEAEEQRAEKALQVFDETLSVDRRLPGRSDDDRYGHYPSLPWTSVRLRGRNGVIGDPQEPSAALVQGTTNDDANQAIGFPSAA